MSSSHEKKDIFTPNDLSKEELSAADVVQTVESDSSIQVDAVFGLLNHEGPNYRDVGWIGTAVLLTKSMIGLGVLSLPFVLHTLGIIPGIIVILCVSFITTWSGYIVGQFKLRHPEIYTIDDVGYMLAGRFGREFIGLAFWLYMTMITGSGLLAISIGLNSISSHGTCTAVFVAVAAIVSFGLGSIRTLGQISWLGWVGLISILTAIFTLCVSVGVQDRPFLAPQTGDWHKQVNIIGHPTFYEAIAAVSNVVFSFAGTPAFFGILSEMRDQKMYTRSMFICQGSVTVVYSTIAIVVYYYAGQYVATPALGSAGDLMKKICYGLALPGLCVTTTIFTHLPAKWIFIRALRGSRHLTSNSPTHWIIWLACTLGCVTFSYIVASAVPAFGGLVGLMGALFGTLMSMQVMGFMWLYDHWQYRKVNSSLSYRIQLGWAIFVIVVGSFLMVAGAYGSIIDIRNTLLQGGYSPWSCEDNSG